MIIAIPNGTKPKLGPFVAPLGTVQKTKSVIFLWAIVGSEWRSFILPEPDIFLFFLARISVLGWR